KISGVVQTKDGYLWVGSFTGLARFDGVKFEQVKSDLLSQKETARVGALTRTHTGGLVVAFESGWVGQLDFGESPKILCKLKSFQPEDLVEDSTGAIWISSRAGRVARIQGADVLEMTEKDGLPPGNATCYLTEDVTGRIWFAKGTEV